MALLEGVLSKGSVLISLVYSLLSYFITVAVYRLYLSPLAKFPGPKLAALTLWYEFYYDVVKRGKYTWKIAEMHKQYGGYPIYAAQPETMELTLVPGPIVRISPFELHINDPKYKLRSQLRSWMILTFC